MKILLAEDNPINILLTQKTLSLMGHSVVVAENGQKAVECFQTETFDIIFMDTHMPIMDGFEATRMIRQIEIHPQHVPIIALTGLARKEDLQTCLDAGMDEYLTKPVKKSHLIAMIAKWASAQIKKTNSQAA